MDLSLESQKDDNSSSLECDALFVLDRKGSPKKEKNTPNVKTFTSLKEADSNVSSSDKKNYQDLQLDRKRKTEMMTSNLENRKRLRTESGDQNLLKKVEKIAASSPSFRTRKSVRSNSNSDELVIMIDDIKFSESKISPANTSPTTIHSSPKSASCKENLKIDEKASSQMKKGQRRRSTSEKEALNNSKEKPSVTERRSLPMRTAKGDPQKSK